MKTRKYAKLFEVVGVEPLNSEELTNHQGGLVLSALIFGVVCGIILGTIGCAEG